MSCTSNRHMYTTQHDVDSLTDRLIDSFKLASIDTVMIYTKGCSGCIRGTSKSNYVFWRKSGMNQVRKFETYRGEGIDKNTRNLMQYYIDNKAAIANETFNIKLELSHFRYSQIKVLVGSSDETFRIRDHWIEGNEDLKLVEWMYRIESALFAIESRGGFY